MRLLSVNLPSAPISWRRGVFISRKTSSERRWRCKKLYALLNSTRHVILIVSLLLMYLLFISPRCVLKCPQKLAGTIWKQEYMRIMTLNSDKTWSALSGLVGRGVYSKYPGFRSDQIIEYASILPTQVRVRETQKSAGSSYLFMSSYILIYSKPELSCYKRLGVKQHCTISEEVIAEIEIQPRFDQDILNLQKNHFYSYLPILLFPIIILLFEYFFQDVYI